MKSRRDRHGRRQTDSCPRHATHCAIVSMLLHLDSKLRLSARIRSSTRGHHHTVSGGQSPSAHSTCVGRARCQELSHYLIDFLTSHFPCCYYYLLLLTTPMSREGAYRWIMMLTPTGTAASFPASTQDSDLPGGTAVPPVTPLACSLRRQWHSPRRRFPRCTVPVRSPCCSDQRLYPERR